jgi:uncharacterized protein with HEPN domain
MKPKHARRVPEYLQHILDAIDRATGYVNGMDFNGFEADTRTQDAVIRSIEIIGEAANKTRVADPDFAARHPDIPWDLMYGMRNRIVHDYFEVDLQVVWQTIHRDLPVLRQQIDSMIKELPDAG